MRKKIVITISCSALIFALFILVSHILVRGVENNSKLEMDGTGSQVKFSKGKIFAPSIIKENKTVEITENVVKNTGFQKEIKYFTHNFTEDNPVCRTIPFFIKFAVFLA